jgi:hypothetical protein
MDFPTFQKNATVETQPVVIEGPDELTGATAEERWIKQQWRDAEESGVGETHPLSINRDSPYVTDDPYTV